MQLLPTKYLNMDLGFEKMTNFNQPARTKAHLSDKNLISVLAFVVSRVRIKKKKSRK